MISRRLAIAALIVGPLAAVAESQNRNRAYKENERGSLATFERNPFDTDLTIAYSTSVGIEVIMGSEFSMRIRRGDEHVDITGLEIMEALKQSAPEEPKWPLIPSPTPQNLE